VDVGIDANALLDAAAEQFMAGKPQRLALQVPHAMFDGAGSHARWRAAEIAAILRADGSGRTPKPLDVEDAAAAQHAGILFEKLDAIGVIRALGCIPQAAETIGGLEPGNGPVAPLVDVNMDQFQVRDDELRRLFPCRNREGRCHHQRRDRYRLKNRTSLGHAPPLSPLISACFYTRSWHAG